MRAVLIVAIVVVVIAAALHFAGGSLMHSLAALHGR
jgi:hypothetical protein